MKYGYTSSRLPTFSVVSCAAGVARVPFMAMLVLIALLAAACATANEVHGDIRFSGRNDRSIRAIGAPELPHGCMYGGRWFTEGTVVTTHEACLRCVCAHGALACRRRACATLPDPPPHRCHVLHRKGACCPELHCPDRVTMMEHGASARFENDDYSNVATPASIVHACVEGGTVYSAGSAMESMTACEQCFCLGGARRCVRPRCLPPPAGCRARPSSGACCPQRYYCEHVSTRPPDQKHLHDCEVEGRLIPEGERVVAAEVSRNCTRCFCLRGSVRCQPLSCAPPLLGCKPLLRPGQCCPHQYHCEHKQGLVTPHLSLISDNVLISTRSNDRSFHPSKTNEIESTTKTVTTSHNTTKKASSTQTTKTSPVSTTKVKRKTNDAPPVSFKQKINITTTISTTQKTVATSAIVSQTDKATTEQSTEKVSTEQPEGTVKITVNGTINCTAELSSTSLPLNITVNDTKKINMEAMPRVPDNNRLEIEAHTSSYPNDIITDRNVNGGFDEGESFVINVTSSLRTNTSHSSPKPIMSTFSKVTVPVDLVDTTNDSKKTKGEDDYDYTEPTLPPSLPNLKIIPFVAADAVVDEEVSSKDTVSYPMLEREDKFPVYYPTVESKETLFARREDKFPPTQYPVFVSEKIDPYPSSSEDLNLSSASYPSAHNDLMTREYTVSTSIGNHKMDINNVKKITTKPASSSFSMKTPSVNLFSPPVETEGGFIPKGPGIIDEYYAVYPSTPPGPPVPHLTTSMQLDVIKGECVTGDGRHIPEGDSISLACSICACAWGELHCSPRPCHTPAGCRRTPATNNAGDLCCGELICNKENKTTLQAVSTTEKIKIDTSTPSIENETKLSDHDTIQDKKTEITNNNTSISNNNTTDKVDKTKLEETTSNPISMENSSSVPSTITSTTTSTTTTTTTSTITTPIYKETNETTNHSQEYDEEDEDDEGYFFGNVLKLILSDNYDTTIAPHKKKSTTSVTVSNAPKTSSTTPLMTTSRRPTPKPTIAAFVPMPHHHINYVPPKSSFQQNTVNRIDHLVLGEATAIKKTTPRPPTTSFKTKISSFKPYPTSRPTTQRPFITTRLTEATKVEPSVQYTPRPFEGSRPPSQSLLPGIGPGLLKLAGCNIYGRMYRVGRIITELSTPCQECWCTEIGVQCKQLIC